MSNDTSLETTPTNYITQIHVDRDVDNFAFFNLNTYIDTNGSGWIQNFAIPRNNSQYLS